MELPTGQAGRTNTPRPTRPLQTASLATFRGDALTDLLAGLAANSIGSFVKGFTPLRASIAGLFTTDILTKPGMRNSPDSFSSLYPTVAICSMTAFTSPLETCVPSAIASISWFLVMIDSFVEVQISADD